jgi:CRP-like cAMP-binding protein
MFGIERKLRVLRGLSAFGACDRRALLALAVIADEAEVPVGEVVWRQGGLARDCAVVVDGSLAVEIDGIHVATVRAGELVGELGVLDGRARSATVVAHEPVRLLLFAAPWFRTVVHDHPRVGEAVRAAAASHRRGRVAWVA